MNGFGSKAGLPKNDDEKMMTASGKVVDKKMAKNFGKDMLQDKVADDQAKITQSLKDKGSKTTYGNPESYYLSDGSKVSSDMDHGNLSDKKTDSKGTYVENIEATTKYPAGTKFYTNKL